MLNEKQVTLFNVLKSIFTVCSAPEQREEHIRKIVRDAIGQFGEPNKHHRIGVRFISEEAHALLSQSKKPTLDQLHSFVTGNLGV